jgi:hypothetical protein
MPPSVKTVYLAWLAPPPQRSWYPIGRLECTRKAGGPSAYRFLYLQGAQRAARETGFTPVDGFPSFTEVYESRELFPLFQNRVMNRSRSGFQAYLDSLALQPEAREPIHILAVSGGRRRTDSFEVFPKIERASEGHFEVTFFLHGIRHFAEGGGLDRVNALLPGARLKLAREDRNQGTGRPALRLETADGQPVGYTPNYLVPDFQYIQDNCVYEAEVFVERVTPANPLDSRVLLRMVGCWPQGYYSMQQGDFAEIPVLEHA